MSRPFLRVAELLTSAVLRCAVRVVPLRAGDVIVFSGDRLAAHVDRHPELLRDLHRDLARISDASPPVAVFLPSAVAVRAEQSAAGADIDRAYRETGTYGSDARVFTGVPGEKANG